MLRKDQPIEELLSLTQTERQQLIATLDEAKVDLYIFLIKNYLLSQNNMEIDLAPEQESTYSGLSHFTHFTNYKGTAQFIDSNNQSFNNLLIELTDRKSVLELAWKNEVAFLLHALNKSIQTLSGKETIEEDKTTLSPDILKTNRELNNDLKKSVQEIFNLKSLIAGKDKLIAQQKELSELLKKQMEEKQNEIKQLHFQLNISKNINNELKLQLEEKVNFQQQISSELLQEIIKKFETQKYSFFSRTPATIIQLKTLLGKPVITKTDIRIILNDPKHLLDRAPESRDHLTNREKLICALREAFQSHTFLQHRNHI